MLPKFIMDTLIRRKKARFEALPFDRVSVRIARTEQEYEDAFRLVQVAYAYEGIEDVGRSILRMTNQHVLPEAIVLVAYEGQQLVGTMTLTLDSPARLPLDRDYPEEVAELRREEHRLAEVGSFAVVKRCWGNGTAQLLAMAAMRLAFRFFDVSKVCIGVHPKVTSFYRAVWGFSPLGGARAHTQLHAPVAAMAVGRAGMLDHLQRCFRAPVASGYHAHEHTHGAPALPNSELVEAALDRGERPWRMPRAIFRRFFIERTNHLERLNPTTRLYLEKKRSDATLANVSTLRSPALVGLPEVA